MKIAVFSDIHGNIFSFETLYKEIIQENCDMHLFLGDLCGYYYFQEEITGMLQDLPNLESIIGNHDQLFLGALEDEKAMGDYTRIYGRSFEFLKETLSAACLGFLQRLPVQYSDQELGIAAFHGSPWDPIHQYVYPDSNFDRFDELPFKTVFLGHTHRPMDIKRQGIRIVNPGSAGQPRDGGWPSFAVYDTGKDSVQLKRCAYDVDAMIREIKIREDNAYLVEVLERSRGEE